ncbi:MAG: phospho-sugar mutase, partial [Planctomycetes bacterium]|nr:phospho-sugar mutase [Planctomycetota bacterium]
VYVKQNRSNQSEMPKAVVACDTRHHSKEFAQITASVLAGHSFQVFLFAEPRATPELSFAVRHLKCDAGVMISASHNPPSDNGFKAYWGNGGQVLPPHDAGIIECVDSATDIPMVPFNEGLADGRIQSLGDDIDMAYVNEVCRLSLSDHRDIRILYTPLHGVGETSVFRVLQQAGFENVTIFEPQRSQDGSFPNVPDHLPNPERAAVFGPAIVEAERMSADLILASDPDADRMAVAVRDHLGNYHCLTGNQLASLLADYVLSQVERAGKLTSQHYLVETLVTSQLIQAIGRHYGVDVISDLLVGFKYIAAAVDSRGADTFLFAAEESIGFMAGNYCRDKDASIGALYAAELGALLKGDGKTLIDRLHELYSLHGFHGDESRSITCPGS